MRQPVHVMTLVALAYCAAAPLARGQAPPATGRDLLQAMHDAYAGRWFSSLTFTQRTTRPTAEGHDTVATWYESLRFTEAAGTQLRIDVGNPATGTGVLYSADSLWVFRGGKQIAARAGGNALLPLIQGVYVQPLARTLVELAPTAVDLSRAVVSGRWRDRPVWIAGAASVDDTISPQFWVDVERKAVVRAILRPVPSAPLMDARLDSLVPLAGGWLATRCEFLVDGKRVQLEEYEGWKANVSLPGSLFDPATWSTAPHWARTAEASAQGADSGRFAIYKLQHLVGTETWTSVPAGAGRTLATQWAFAYIGSAVALHETLTTLADGTPARLRARGQTSTLTDVDLQMEVAPEDTGTAGVRILDRGRERRTRRPPLFFTTHHYPPAAIEEALYRYWVAHGRPRPLPLLPDGSVTLDHRGDDTLPGVTPVVVHRYSLSGLVWGRQSLWVTEDGRVAAVIGGDAELDRLEEVRAGFEPFLPRFVAGAVRDGLADLAAAARAAPPARAGAYAIVGARLIDGTGAPPIEDAVVIVRDGRIEAAGPRGTVAVPPGLPKEPANGKTIIPGLWDMHVHFEQVEWPAAQLAAGVTTARDVGNELELATALRAAIAAGRVPGPRLLLAGLIDGAPDGLGAFLADTPDEARAVVGRYHAAGYQQIKIYGSLPPALVRVVTAEAHRLGMTVTGHVPRGMNARQFVEAGADQINHLGYVLLAVQPAPPSGQPWPPLDFESPTVREAIAFFKRHGTVLDPTLARSEQNAHPKDSAFAVYEPGAAHAPPALLEVLNASGSRAEAAPTRMRTFENVIPLVAALARAGVPIVAGTDLVVPGHSIARELELYVQAGMTPMEALQAATIVPARVMGLDRESGTIAPGKRADLVILDGNPLESIRALRRVGAVIAAGRLYRPAALWRMAEFAP
ncbi:MAG: amidohydrolase family protein [Deltaproteobacteria bacterium]